MATENHTVIIDSGSYIVRAGFAGDSAPKATFSNLFGPHDEEQTLRRIFEDELGLHSKGQKVLITDHVLSSKESREKIAKILFGKLEVSCLFFAKDSVLSLYASGREDGVVVDIGHQHAYVVPVVKGYVVTSAVQKSEVTGEALDHFLAQGLREKGHTAIAGLWKYVREVKETMSIVASNGDGVSASPGKFSPMFEGKQTQTIYYPWAKCAEAIFNPSIAGLGGEGIPILVQKAIGACEQSVQDQLWSNILVTSGVVQCPGFSERLQIETTALNPSAKVTYVLPNIATWIGGSILASLPQMAELFVTKEQYDAQGPEVLHKI